MKAENLELVNEKNGLDQAISEKSNTIKEKEKKISELNTESSEIEESLIDLRDRHKLYSKDMKSISLDSNKQLYTYASAAGFTLLLASTLMILLLGILTNSSPYTDKLLSFFSESPNLRFYSIVMVRVSISAAFVFLIVVFLNLTRGFVSQFIKARNRLTALRMVDFLSSRLKSSTIPSNPEEENTLLVIEREGTRQQVELLNEHIPKIMDLGTSSFDKQKDSFRQIKKVKELLNTTE